MQRAEEIIVLHCPMCGTGQTTSGILECCTAWGTISFQERLPLTGNSCQLAIVG